MRRILITGAGGRIGRCLREGLRQKGMILRLTDVVQLGAARDGEEVIVCDLAHLNNALQLVDGVNGVVHLAGLVGADLAWDEVLRNNIGTTYNVLEAARRKGVKRVVLASSIHVHGFLRRNKKASASSPYRPDSLYGLAKVFGEAAGRLYADKYGLEVICLRIASFRPKPTTRRELGTWLSPRDAVQLVKRSLDAADIHFEILYGVSQNEQRLFSVTRARELGYVPQDSSTGFAGEILGNPQASEEPALEALFHGAHFIPPGFVGDLEDT